MGKGNYLGGHTVVGPRSGWFSFKRKRSEQAQSSKKVRSKEVASYQNSDGLRASFLHAVIAAEISNKPQPDVPRKAGVNLKEELRNAGGAFQWAREQPEYHKLMVKKRQKKLAKTLLAAQTPSTSPKSANGSSKRIDKLRSERMKVLAAKAEALRLAQEFDDRLRDIEREIETLHFKA